MRNILGAGGVRLLSLAVSLLSVPLLLQLLGKSGYGVWATLTALLAWVGLLDLGVGNSLRNSVSGMVAARQQEMVRQEFLGLFRLLGLVAAAALVLLLLALPMVELLRQHWVAAVLLFVPALAMLPLLLGASVLQGAGRVALHAVLQASAAWGFLAVVGTAVLLSLSPSLEAIAAVYSLCSLFAVLAVFRVALRELGLAPVSLGGAVRAALPLARVRVGVGFLVLQLSSLVLFGIGNLIIYGNLGAAEVARYDVLNKVFQIGLGLYNIVIAVMWSEISRRRALGDLVSLRRLHGRLLLLALAFALAAIGLAAAAPWLVALWSRGVVMVSVPEALALATLVSVQALAYVGAVFMNAFERIGLQVRLSLLSIVLMVPLSLVLLDADLGIAAVPLAAAVLTCLPMVACNLYTRSLLGGKHAQDAV